MEIVLTDLAQEQYLSWVREGDGKTLDKITALLTDIQRDPYHGIGKPEPLRHEFSGQWSRRINRKDRLRYLVKENKIFVLSCREHYLG